MGHLRTTIFLSLLTLPFFAGVIPVHAIDPRFALDPGMLRKNLSDKGAPTATLKKREAPLPRSGKTVYTVKKGKSNAKTARYKTGKRPIPFGRKEIVTHRLSLFKGARESAGDAIRGARLVWDTLLPGNQNADPTYSVNGERFSLDLDAAKFPVFSTVKGDRIIVDTGGNLSPLVKSLIEQHDPGSRLITYIPGDKTAFFSDLLNAAGFYSVESDFSVSFGTDPKLTVNADFKVEKDPDSPLQQDIFLINTTPGKGGFPQVLAGFMARQGFRVIDVSPSFSGEKGRSGNTISVITEEEPYAMTERLLSALRQGFERNRAVELFSMGDGGVGLKIKADRYFVRNGKRYVVSVFKGDPEEYTLLRLLDSMNYHVIILDANEDFRSLSSKILSRMDLSGSYAMHDLIPAGDMPYSIQMSGIMIDAPKGTGKVLLTEKRPDPVIAELLKINGYMIGDSVR
jgi:hypothetical protein